MTEEEYKELINDPDCIEGILYKINTGIEIPYPHNLYSYFKTGHCNIYGLILTELFGVYAVPYVNHDHVITKIGDNFYDVEGMMPKRLVESLGFEEITADELYDLPLFRGLGDYTKGIDDKLIETAVKIGRDFIQEIIEKRKKTKGGHSL